MFDAFMKGVKNGVRNIHGPALSSGAVHAIAAVTPDIKECRVCGGAAVDYEVCYDCAQNYYPPREYWQEVTPE